MVRQQSRQPDLCDNIKYTFQNGIACNVNGNNYKVTDGPEECLDILVNEEKNSFFVRSLHKCPHFSGSKIMEKIEQVARTLKFSKIDLQDGAHITVECGKMKPVTLMLNMLNILADGQSWYNSIGYKSPNHEAELAHNHQIGQMNVLDFLEKTLSLRKNPYKRMDYWGSTDSKTVQEYFSDIKRQLKESLPSNKSPRTVCMKYRWLGHVLEEVRQFMFTDSKEPYKVLYDNLNLSLDLKGKKSNATRRRAARR